MKVNMKPITYILRLVLFSIVAAILIYFAKPMIFPKINESEIPINAHYVVPVKSKIIKDALVKRAWTFSGNRTSYTISFPDSSKDTLAINAIENNQSIFGVTLSKKDDINIITLTKGKNSTIIIPVPMLISLIDKGVINIDGDDE